MAIALPEQGIPAGELLQHVSRVAYRGKPLHYGRDATNRYDDPDQGYRVLYLGRSLPMALMESVFHVRGQCGPGPVAERRSQQFVNVAVADVAARAGLQGLVRGARQCFERHASSFRFTSSHRGSRTRLSPR